MSNTFKQLIIIGRHLGLYLALFLALTIRFQKPMAGNLGATGNFSLIFFSG